MSKQSSDDLVRKINSGREKIERITKGKARAQGQVDRADQEVRETEAVVNGYIGLLQARGLNEDGEPINGVHDDEGAPEFE